MRLGKKHISLLVFGALITLATISVIMTLHKKSGYQASTESSPVVFSLLAIKDGSMNPHGLVTINGNFDAVTVANDNGGGYYDVSLLPSDQNATGVVIESIKFYDNSTGNTLSIPLGKQLSSSSSFEKPAAKLSLDYGSTIQLKFDNTSGQLSFSQLNNDTGEYTPFP